MAILTKNQILARIKSGDIAFTPHLDIFQVQAHAIDLRLGFTFLIPKSWKITKKGREAISADPLRTSYGSEYFDVVELEEGQFFDLLPEEHVSVCTLESIKVPADLMSVLYPRSSVNRKGLSVDLTGIIDSGYEGQLTIPIRNNTKSQIIRLYPGERFCQVIFEELNEVTEIRKSRYHNRDIVEGIAKEKANEVALITRGAIKKLKEKHRQNI
ncbi:dCTP deaminase [bacterium]|nr:dCTP deaminase [bacterium]